MRGVICTRVPSLRILQSSNFFCVRHCSGSWPSFFFFFFFFFFQMWAQRFKWRPLSEWVARLFWRWHLSTEEGGGGSGKPNGKPQIWQGGGGSLKKTYPVVGVWGMGVGVMCPETVAIDLTDSLSGPRGDGGQNASPSLAHVWKHTEPHSIFIGPSPMLLGASPAYFLARRPRSAPGQLAPHPQTATHEDGGGRRQTRPHLRTPVWVCLF